MLQVLRNFFAKSGGLVLLILAFLIVGILAFLTIRAAQRGVQTAADLDVDAPTVVVDESPTTGSVDIVDSIDVLDNDTDSTDSSDANSDNSNSNVNADDDSVSDDNDGVVVAPDDETDSSTDAIAGGVGGGDDEGQVAGATDVRGENGEETITELPNTGPAETLLATFAGLAVVAVLGSRWNQSRKILRSSLLR